MHSSYFLGIYVNKYFTEDEVYRRRDRSVGIVTGHGLDGLSSIPGRDKRLSLLHSI
jgi:hypothetical protein